MLELSRETFEFYAGLATAVALILVALIYSSQTTESYLLIKSVFTQFSLIILITIYWFYIIYRRCIYLAFYKSYWPLMVFLATLVFSIPFSVNPPLALLKSTELLLLIMFFLIISQRKLGTRKLVVISISLVLAGGVVAAYYLLTKLRLYVFHNNIRAALHTLGSASFNAQWLAPIIPVGLVLARENGKTFFSKLILACTACMIISLGLTMNLSSALSLFAGIVVIYYLALSSPHTAGHGKASLIRLLLTILLCSVVGFSLYFNKDNQELNSRFRLWRESKNIIFDNPWFGVGKGNFSYAFPPYASNESWLNIQYNNEHLNNDYLETTIEQGVVGGLSFIGFLLIVFFQMVRFLRKDSEEYNLAVAYGAGWLVLVFNGMNSFNLTNPATAVMFWFFSGCLLSVIEPARQRKYEFEFIYNIRWILYTGACLFGLVTLFYVYYPFASNTFTRNALNEYKKGNLPKAAEELRKAISLYDCDYKNYLLLGNILREQGDAEKAIQAYQKVIKLSPNYHHTYNYLGQLYKEAGQYDLAVDAYKKALLINPNFLEVFNNLGGLYALLGQFDLAEQSFQGALKINPGLAEIYYNLGNLMFRQNKTDHAAIYYLQAIQSEPDKAPFHNNLGVVYKQTKRYLQAVREFTKTIALDPSFVSAYNNLGNTYLEMNKYQEAVGQYQLALELRPEYLRAQFNLAYAYEQSGDVERAVMEWRKISRGYPNSEEGKLALSNLIRLGKVKRVKTGRTGNPSVKWGNQ